jgi:hypothetical protein
MAHGYVPDPETLGAMATPEEIGVAVANWVMFRGMNEEQIAAKIKYLRGIKWGEFHRKGDIRVDKDYRREVCIESGAPGLSRWVRVADDVE